MPAPRTAPEVYSLIANAVSTVKGWTAADVHGDIDDLPAYGRLREISGDLVKAVNTLGGSDESSAENSEDDHVSMNRTLPLPSFTCP